MGVDSISLGSVLGFAMEASEKGLIKEKLSWGNLAEAKQLAEDIVMRRGLGDVLAEGVREAAQRIGGGSADFAMHVKGLEISAYDCHSAPAMALAYGTNPVGAHHKDAWVIGWETTHDRLGYGEEKATRVIELSTREAPLSFWACAVFPIVNLGFDREWYPKYLQLATGQEFTWDKLNETSERVFNLVRAFWIREHPSTWSNEMDVPPVRWFNEPLAQGQLKGVKLDRQRYDALLQSYYQKRGWKSKRRTYEGDLGQTGTARRCRATRRFQLSLGDSWLSSFVRSRLRLWLSARTRCSLSPGLHAGTAEP